MLLVYVQQRDRLLPITQAWITGKNEIYGRTVAGNEVLLAEYADDCQAQCALDQIYGLMPEPKFGMPENFVDKYSVEQTEEKCKQCAYNQMSRKEIEDLGADPCDTCKPETLSNWKQKEKAAQ